MKKITSLAVSALLALSMLFALCSCTLNYRQKHFTFQGLTITLTEEFEIVEENEEENYVLIEGRGISVTIIEIERVASQIRSSSDVAKELATQYGVSADKIKTYTGIANNIERSDINHTEKVDGVSYLVMDKCYYRHSSSYVVEFVCLRENAGAYAADIEEWTRSIRFV